MMIICLLIILLIIAAVWPLGLAAELTWGDKAGELRLLWLPLPPLGWRLPLLRRRLGGGLPGGWSWPQLKGAAGELWPEVAGLCRRLRLTKSDLRLGLPAELLGNAARGAILGGTALLGLELLLARFYAGLAEAPRAPGLAVLPGKSCYLRLELAGYLPLLPGLLHIWRLRRAYLRARGDVHGYAGEHEQQSRRAAEY